MAACRHLCLERLCHFLFQLCSISIRYTPAAVLQALSKSFHLAMLAGDGVVRVLEGAEQQRDVLALTDAIFHPRGVFNPIVHNANHHIGGLRIVHGQKEFALTPGILLIPFYNNLLRQMHLIHYNAETENLDGVNLSCEHGAECYSLFPTIITTSLHSESPSTHSGYTPAQQSSP